MKIIIFTNNLRGDNGWGRYSLELALQFKSLGHQVVVFCQEKTEGLSLRQISALPGPLKFKLLYPGFILVLFNLFKYKDEFKEVKVIHSFIEPYSWIALCVSKIFKIEKFFITVHGSFLIKLLSNPLIASLQRLSYRAASRIVIVSSYTNKIAESRIKGKITVISNGINKNLFIDQLKKKKNVPKLISVGEIKARKGYLESLKVIKEIVADFPSLTYTIVGRIADAEYKEKIDRYIQSNNLEKNILFVGNVSEEEKNNLFDEASIFLLLPIQSYYDFEGFGLVYLEANARKLPTIGSAESGAMDAIKNDYSGFLVDPLDTVSVANKLRLLLTDSKLYDSMSDNAFEWAKQSIWENKVKQYIDIYNK